MRALKPILTIFAVAALAAAPAWAAKETFTDKQSFDAKAGMTLEIETAFFDVDVEVHGGNSVEVDVFMEIEADERERAEELVEEYKPRYDTSSNRITIESKSNRKWRSKWRDINSTKAVMTIKVPKGMHLDLSTASGDMSVKGDLGDAMLEANLASGDLDVEGAMEELDLNSASGDVTIRLDRPVRILEVNAASGDIEVYGGAGRVKANTASGRLIVEDIQGEARLSTASGDIEASWTRIDDDTRIECSAASGDIELTLPGDVELSGYLDTSSGRIRADYPGHMNRRKDRFEFDGGRGAAELEVTTASGNVTIRKR